MSDSRVCSTDNLTHDKLGKGVNQMIFQPKRTDEQKRASKGDGPKFDSYGRRERARRKKLRQTQKASRKANR